MTSRWVLWVSDSQERFIPDWMEDHAAEAAADGLVPVWTCIARGPNDAERQRYAWAGWGEYQPMLREDGTPYPEHEDDGR